MRTIEVDGEDSFENWGLLLTSVTLSPPAPKTHLVDVPGGDGSIDLTEALTGDIAYGDRSQTFEFAVPVPDSFETAKTRISNCVHGRRLAYRLSWDPGYTYYGRFAVKSYEESPGVGRIALDVVADPYKTRNTQSRRLNACGGRMYRLESGRKPVQPVIECGTPTRVTFGGRTTVLGIGTWRLNDVVFRQGWNDLYINSYEVFATVWSSLSDKTWANFSGMRWDEVCALGVEGETVRASIWEDLAEGRWGALAASTWNSLKYEPADAGDYETYLTYDWSDL